jgi:hypothetical protein
MIKNHKFFILEYLLDEKNFTEDNGGNEQPVFLSADKKKQDCE